MISHIPRWPYEQGIVQALEAQTLSDIYAKMHKTRSKEKQAMS